RKGDGTAEDDGVVTDQGQEGVQVQGAAVPAAGQRTQGNVAHEQVIADAVVDPAMDQEDAAALPRLKAEATASGLVKEQPAAEQIQVAIQVDAAAVLREVQLKQAVVDGGASLNMQPATLCGAVVNEHAAIDRQAAIHRQPAAHGLIIREAIAQ